LLLEQGVCAKILDQDQEIYTEKFFGNIDFENTLDSIGKIALPPYIKRNEVQASCDDKVAYQTIYASQKGAVAAPTAGLHFSKDLLGKLKSKGVKLVEITLHISYGTFLPVRVSDIRKHKMHSESYSISRQAAGVINNAKTSGSRIVAVGTTCTRTLEYASDDTGKLAAGSGSCDLFIYPGYRFKIVDALVTNFHLPKSTLIMLVSAFAGRETVLAAYLEAVKNNYRFYSYGDAMFIA